MHTAQDEIRAMIRAAENNPVIDLMNLHAQEVERLRAEHDAVETELRQRDNENKLTNYWLRQSLRRWKTLHYLVVLFAACAFLAVWENWPQNNARANAMEILMGAR